GEWDISTHDVFADVLGVLDRAARCRCVHSSTSQTVVLELLSTPAGARFADPGKRDPGSEFGEHRRAAQYTDGYTTVPRCYRTGIRRGSEETRAFASAKICLSVRP